VASVVGSGHDKDMPVRVKICGITNVEDAVAAAQMGADFIGLNFYPRSPRCISEGQARLILQSLPSSARAVALFVNESWKRIHDVTSRLAIQTIQVHSDEVEPCPLVGRNWIPAISVQNESSIVEALRPLELQKIVAGETPVLQPWAVLMDGHLPGAF